MQKTSPDGIKRICDQEDCKLVAYQDRSPRRIWTIGWGHTGAGVTQGLTITRERAVELLHADLVRVEACVNGRVVLVTQNQFDALVSLCFNIGNEAFADSTLVRKINAGDPRGAALEFSRWVHSGDEILDDLVKRRAAEQKLFERPEAVIPTKE